MTLQDEFYYHYNKSNTRQAIDVFLVGLAALAVPLPAPTKDEPEACRNRYGVGGYDERV